MVGLLDLPSTLTIRIAVGAFILQQRTGEFYVHYVDTDKRMDEWISEDLCTTNDPVPVTSDAGNRKRKRSRWNETTVSLHEASSSKHGPAAPNGLTRTIDKMERKTNESQHLTENSLTEEEPNLTRPKEFTSQRNFDTVIFDEYKIRPWCVFLSVSVSE